LITYSEGTEEFVERDSLAAITVKVLEENLNLLVVQINVVCLESINELSCIKLPVAVVVENAEHTGHSSQSHGTARQKSLLDIVDESDTVIGKLLRSSDGLSSRRIGRRQDLPDVLITECLIRQVNDGSTHSLLGKLLRLRVSVLSLGGDLELSSELVAIHNVIVREQLLGRAMLDSQLRADLHRLTNERRSSATRRKNAPHSVIQRPSREAHFLVSGEASENCRGSLSRMKVQWLVEHMRVGHESDMLAISHDSIALLLNLLNRHDVATAGS
jgi:hypothetical protein